MDSFLSNSFIARAGLNYGSTKSLGSSTFTPCGSSTRWVHGCDFSYPYGWRIGIARTWESPEGYQRALMRRSNTTSVYSVQRDILYAYHFWATSLGFPTSEESGTTTITQFFQGGYIEKKPSPCQTKAVSYSLGTLQTYSGVCN